MQVNEISELSKLWRDAYSAYGQQFDPAGIALVSAALRDYSLEQIREATIRHAQHPEFGRFPPRPADIIREIQAVTPPDGHPGPEEAWNLLLAFVQDEAESGFLTDEMRQAWEASGPSMSSGDHVGARMAFLEKYRAAVALSRSRRAIPVWSFSQGQDKSRIPAAVQRAVEAGWITAERGQQLLPTPSASLSDLARLEAPADAYPGDPAPWPGRNRTFRAITCLARLGASLH